MHERMKYMAEVVRHGIELDVLTKTNWIEHPEKYPFMKDYSEAVEYLKNDDEIEITFEKKDDEYTIIHLKTVW